VALQTVNFRQLQGVQILKLLHAMPVD